jgi:hypothetical protein
MPVTPFQQEVFRLLSSHRSPDSYVAGGTVIQRAPDSSRTSDDIDIFHDSPGAVAASAGADAETLRSFGFDVQFRRQESTFCQASISKGDESIRLDWAMDSAFRFFPVVPDEMFGFRLHDADVATNKVLAAAGRQKVRDFIDLIYLDKTYVSLGVAIWAASGKDEGFTPDLILSELRRNCRINPASLEGMALTPPQSPTLLKAEWLKSFDAAEKLLASLPPDKLGCLFLDKDTGLPGSGPVFDPSWKPHFGTIKGAWPRLAE